MPQLFLNRRKRASRRYIRPIKSNVVSQKVIETAVENKKPTALDMDNLEKVKEIVGKNVKVPKRKVKVEKKDKGLIERTDESTIVLTEDNKMMLVD